MRQNCFNDSINNASKHYLNNFELFILINQFMFSRNRHISPSTTCPIWLSWSIICHWDSSCDDCGYKRKKCYDSVLIKSSENRLSFVCCPKLTLLKKWGEKCEKEIRCSTFHGAAVRFSAPKRCIIIATSIWVCCFLFSFDSPSRGGAVGETRRTKSLSGSH